LKLPGVFRSTVLPVSTQAEGNTHQSSLATAENNLDSHKVMMKP